MLAKFIIVKCSYIDLPGIFKKRILINATCTNIRAGYATSINKLHIISIHALNTPWVYGITNKTTVTIFYQITVILLYSCFLIITNQTDKLIFLKYTSYTQFILIFNTFVSLNSKSIMASCTTCKYTFKRKIHLIEFYI